MSDGLDTSSLLTTYLEDAVNHLDALDSALLDMERDWESTGFDQDLVNDILGSLHTLKGNSGMMGFVTIQRFVHQLEGVFKNLLADPSLLNQKLFDALFENASLLRSVVEAVGTDPQPDLAQETTLLETLAVEGVTAAGAKSNRRTETSRAQVLRNQNETAPGSLARTNVLRVDFERLDHLLNLTGELVIHKTKLNQIVKRIEEFAGEQHIFNELSGAVEMVEKTAGALQEAIMRVRMLPIRHVFQRFPRMVRDLARQKNKDVSLVFSGEDTEIDKTVIDALGDPLIHLIRNAIDHGIEPPETRRRNGKEPEGTIRLSARQESGNIVITVEDDGSGMNAERIRAKAVDKGLVGPEQQLSEEDVYNLVFLPGFSTAETVTETSGRGVGLDVVKKMIADFNGTIEVKSGPGKGTEFILKMPLTLAIIPSLLVEASGEIFAMPLTSVIESVKLSASDIHRVDGKEVTQLRGGILPVKRLSQVLGLPPSDRVFYYMVVIGRAEKRVGVLVDRLRGQLEVVIKALDAYLGEVTGVSGATILGDGSVVLIVDTARIV